jgi:EamA domain-containing membrane protein RarD
MVLVELECGSGWSYGWSWNSESQVNKSLGWPLNQCLSLLLGLAMFIETTLVKIACAKLLTGPMVARFKLKLL